jgi:hypothetical protein
MKNTKPDILTYSHPEEVNTYLEKMDHPLTGVVKALRDVILQADAQIGEHIKWNAPSFYYMGEIKPFNPKEYKRYIIVFNLFQKDCIRLVFPSGAKINDKTGLLEGDYADGRRLALFYKLEDVDAKKTALQAAIQNWLQQVEK